MRYKVFCSNGHKPDVFYCDDKFRAELLFAMATRCGMFEYVELALVSEECFTEREWSADND